MILSGNKIAEEIQNGTITIEPFNITNINPNSYNYRLDENLLEIDEAEIDPKKPTKYKEILIKKQGYILLPNKLYLANTLETIGSSKYVTSLIGRSSLGRLGLFLQITADLGHRGTCHKWTLELKVVQPLRVYPKMKIGQVSFWEVENEQTKEINDTVYTGEYSRFSCPKISKYYKEMQ